MSSRPVYKLRRSDFLDQEKLQMWRVEMGPFSYPRNPHNPLQMPTDTPDAHPEISF